MFKKFLFTIIFFGGLLFFFFGFFPAKVQAQDFQNTDCLQEVNQWYNLQITDCIKDNQQSFESNEITLDVLAEKNNFCSTEKFLPDYQKKAQQCLQKVDFGWVWGIPILKSSLENVYSDFQNLKQSELTDLNNCLLKVAEGHDLKNVSKKVQETLSQCFKKVGLIAMADIYDKQGIVIDCAQETSKMKNKSLSSLILKPTLQEKEYLKQCIIKKASPVIAGIALVNVPISSGFLNFLIFFQFLFTQPVLFFRKKYYKNLGKVFDSTTSLPVDLSVVRVLDYKTGKIVKSQVTNRKGEFLFLTKLGEFKLFVEKIGYSFPSSFFKSKKRNYYLGGKIIIKKSEQVISDNIPLDPIDVKVSSLKFYVQKIKRILTYFVALISPLLSLVSLFLLKAWWTWLLFIIHVILFLLFLRLSKKDKRQKFGKVFNIKNKNLSKVVVSVFEKKFNKRLAYYVTDLFGRYYFPSIKGEFILTFEKKGYKKVTKDVIITEREDFNLDICLKLE